MAFGRILALSAVAMTAAARQDPPALPEKTTVTPYLQTGHRKGQNLIWCNTFQLAWSAMSTDVCGEPLRLEGEPVLVRAMNQGGPAAKDLDPESVYVKAGKTSPALIDEINTALKKKFGENCPSPLRMPVSPEAALAVAYLCKTLSFATPFERQREPLPWSGAEGEKTPLQAFGILKVDGKTPKELTSQVQILHDRHGEYVVELKTTSAKDRLIVAQLEPKATLQETLEEVRTRVRSSKSPIAIQVTDQCLVPCVQIALERIYDEILGRKVLNARLKDHVLAEARQSLRFSLDEKGATVKSEAKILSPKNGHAPRRIVFDRPFLLYLERVGAENPYLAIWFENPNLFLRSEVK